MSTPDTVRVAVSAVASYPSTPANKRRITPSSEQSSSKRTLILTTPTKRPSNISQSANFPTQPFFAPRQLFPGGVATIAHQYTHAHPSPQEQQEEGAIWHNRHVLLPFNLRDRSVNTYVGDVRSLLYNLFPGTTNIAEPRFRSHLLFQVKELPRRPWPLTVGGLPITILDESDRGRALMFPRLNLGNMAISSCPEGYDVGDFSDKVLRELAASVHAQFRNMLPNLRVVELMFTCERTFYIIVDNHVKIDDIKAKLPGKIANCPVGYMNDNELHRPLWANLQAKGQIEPQPLKGVVDNTAYDILRPGVMICSQTLGEHSHRAVFSTTSGVLVQNSAGDRFMTGASHGIGESEQVGQAGRSDKMIGKAVVDISWTDISLVELNKDVKYVNETFENSGGGVPNFTRLVTSEDKFEWSSCSLNSPYTGHMEGSVVAKSVRFESSAQYHPTQDSLRYVVYNWSFMGQEEDNHDKTRPPDGTCGSVIWDNDKGVILGFYH